MRGLGVTCVNSVDSRPSTLDARKHLLHPAGSKNTGVGNDQCFAATEIASHTVRPGVKRQGQR